MTREEMLRALQADVNAWPQEVKAAGVKNAAGAAYVPVARNNEVLRTPNDPEATLRYMIETWSVADDESGSDGWDRIITQAGPGLTWEWFMVDDSRPYAELFPQEIRERVRTAMYAHPSYAAWERVAQDREREAAPVAERIARIQEEMRSGKRPRPAI
jgi:hypothetical protein